MRIGDTLIRLSSLDLGEELSTIMMRGSNCNGNLETEPGLGNEVELLLLQKNHSLFLEREMGLNIKRSGSAPPTAEGALRNAANLYINPNFVDFNDSSNGNRNSASMNGFLTEEEIRSHPAYVEYYYSNANLNPRLPQPVFSKEDWRVVQRFRAAGLSRGTRNKELNDNNGRSSLFSMQSAGLSVEKTVDELVKLRKAALRNSLARGSPGLRNSHTLQDGPGQPLTSHPSQPLNQNPVGDVLGSMGLSNSKKAESFDAILTEKARLADSLSGLSISRGQLHNEDILKSSPHTRMPAGHNRNHRHRYSEKLGNDTNNAYLTKDNRSKRGLSFSKSAINEQMSFPRNPEDMRILARGNHFPDVGGSSHVHNGYMPDQNLDMMIDNNLAAELLSIGASGDGWTQISSNGARSHFPVTGPGQFEYLHERNMANIGGSHGHEHLQALERAYLEELNVQQKQRHLSLSSHNKPSSINRQYHFSRANSPSAAPFHGNLMAYSLHNINVTDPTVGCISPMFQNDKNSQFPSTLRGTKGKPLGPLNPQSRNNMKGRLGSALDMAKNNNTNSLELSDILGRVVEFSKDQYGSRFIQQKLETATHDEKIKIFAEIITHAHSLVIDVFGNYVIQKFIEHGTDSQRKELGRLLMGRVLPLSLHMYGCRVIQKALEVADVELQTEMVAELNGSVMRCVRDQNGNHVIQKCIEYVPQDRIQFIVSSCFGQVVTLSTHPYGCRVIQRVLEHCNDPKTREIFMDEIMSSVCYLAQDQYGNYVLQHVLKHGKPHERSAIISKLAGQMVKMSQQKFASNVIEKCFIYGSPQERKLLVNEMLGSTDENEPLQAMMKDPFGNYVVQKVLETCDDHSRDFILSRIKVHLNALKRYTYGKHIVARVEKLVATGERQMRLPSFNSY